MVLSLVGGPYGKIPVETASVDADIMRMDLLGSGRISFRDRIMYHAATGAAAAGQTMSSDVRQTWRHNHWNEKITLTFNTTLHLIWSVPKNTEVL